MEQRIIQITSEKGPAECERTDRLEATLIESIRKFKEGDKVMVVNPPALKYLQFLHPLMRPLIIEHWEVIKSLDIVLNKIRCEIGLNN